MRYFIALFTFLTTCTVHAQDQSVIDSCKAIIEEAKHDTSVCNAYLSWGEEIYLNNPDTALILWEKANEIARTHSKAGHPPALHKKYLWSLADAQNNIGAIYKNQGDIPKTLESLHKSLKNYEEIGNKSGIATSLNNIGYIYSKQGDIPKALEYYHKSLKIREVSGNKSGIATSLNNIGEIYKHQGDIPKALEYHHKSLKIREEIGEKIRIAMSLNNLGYIYNSQGDIPRALEYHHKSLIIQEEFGDKEGIAISLNNIGYIYYNQGDPSITSSKKESLRAGITKALEYYLTCLTIHEEIGNKSGIAMSLNNIGGIEFEQGRLTSALNYGIRGLIIAREIGYPRLISLNSHLLSKVAKKQGNFEEALEMYELHILMRDSIKNEENQKATIRQQTKYEFEKAQLVREQDEREAARLVVEETSRRDNLQYSFILLGLLVLGSLVLGLGKLSLPERVAEGLIFFAFLIFFEFILVLADPYVEKWTGGAPGLKLLINAGVAALIFPLHSLFETKLKKRLVKS